MISEIRNKEFRNRLAQIINGESPFVWAKKVGIPSGTFARIWNEGTVPKYEHLCKISDCCNINLNWLLKGEGLMKQDNLTNKSAEHTIPVIGFASCGLSMGWLNEEKLDYQILVPQNIMDKKAFAIVAKGKSMIPEGIAENSTCIVAPSLLPIKGYPVYIKSIVFNNGQKTFVSSIKRFEGNKDNHLLLKGWLDPDEKGIQEPFVEQRESSSVDMFAPIVCVFSPQYPPYAVKDNNVHNFSENIDVTKLAQCLEAIEKTKSSLDIVKQSKIAALLYQHTVNNENIDENYLSELIDLAK
ncbi:MAG: S24 family peptidase [Alphaproteobacteria bacterium]